MLSDGSFSLQFSMRIPIDQLNSAISISIPFYAPFAPTSSSGFSGRSLSGESGESTRLNLYREMEGYVGQITRTDGHSCLLRAMCEVSANPGHEDGLMGKSLVQWVCGTERELCHGCRRHHQLPPHRDLLRCRPDQWGRQALPEGPGRGSGEPSYSQSWPSGNDICYSSPGTAPATSQTARSPSLNTSADISLPTIS